eukprot:TRINITY_DN2612_c0_g1::TRINITY_DN2612_c0_g1_i1::g.25986::m.25986 TRINITY_DN2612_c0_g1::TRINITY_DN2612_c0_g1_i1::g.25986  ORF type:complete len:158 (-),score=-0.51,DUF1092/PF06485.6/0.046 TRINITY_DN2612_c0_g1_i1:628-1101(-)
MLASFRPRRNMDRIFYRRSPLTPDRHIRKRYRSALNEKYDRVRIQSHHTRPTSSLPRYHNSRRTKPSAPRYESFETPRASRVLPSPLPLPSFPAPVSATPFVTLEEYGTNFEGPIDFTCYSPEDVTRNDQYTFDPEDFPDFDQHGSNFDLLHTKSER